MKSRLKHFIATSPNAEALLEKSLFRKIRHQFENCVAIFAQFVLADAVDIGEFAALFGFAAGDFFQDVVVHEALKGWLVETATVENVAPFAILHDNVLKEIASRKPKERSKLADINGIGENKLRKYGDAILKLVAGFPG